MVKHLWGHLMKRSAAVAQLGERGTEDPKVAGSIPAGGTNLLEHDSRKLLFCPKLGCQNNGFRSYIFTLFTNRNPTFTHHNTLFSR